MKRHLITLIAAAGCIWSCSHAVPAVTSEEGESYKLRRVMEVAGRQGVAADSTGIYVSSSTALYKYSKDGELLLSNEDPFAGLALPANHLGDIDVYRGEIYTGIETFIDGVGQNIQVAVYDAETLTYKYSIDWEPASGQVEVCGLAVDREHGRVWMADWVQGHELYCYDIATRSYIGKVTLRPAPQLQQGIVIEDGRVLISCDDGQAEYGESDHIYIADLYDNTQVQQPCGLSVSADVRKFRAMSDFRRAGEIEGLTTSGGDLIVLSNRGARIILGMPSGFYDGYDHEIHELYFYSRD